MFRVTSTGAKSFAFKYRPPGSRETITLTIGSIKDVDLAEARRLVGGFRQMLVNGQDPRENSPRAARKKAEEASIQFGAVADEYVEKYAKPNKDSWKLDEYYLKRAKTWFVGRQIAGLTDDDLAEFLDDIAGDAPVTANRTQSVLHKMFSWAKEPGRKYVPLNPLSDMARRGGKEKRRDRVLSDDEIRVLWRGLDDPKVPCKKDTGLALKLVLATMARPGQVARARVDGMIGLSGDDPQWHLRPEHVKKRREVIVPLNHVSVGIIKIAIKDDGQKVLFPTSLGEMETMTRHSLSQSLNDKPSEDRIGIRAFLGMAHFTPHDLRRTAATISRRAGAPRDDVKALLDHIEGDVTAVYDKYDMLKEKKAVTEILGRELERIIGG